MVTAYVPEVGDMVLAPVFMRILHTFAAKSPESKSVPIMKRLQNSPCAGGKLDYTAAPAF
jgi:hypothetical protein